MTSITKFTAALLLTAFVSCNQPDCRNTNPVFEKNAPESKEYQSELAKLLATDAAKDARYTLNGYIESNDKTYLVVGIANDSICAEGYMLVNEWDGPLKEIQRTKGMGYNGAHLDGLKYTIDADGTLIYKSVDDITD